MQELATAFMLDTVTFGRDWPLRHTLPSGRLLKIKGIMLRLADCGTRLRSAEASLPRLLFGHNGRLIETQGQLDAALTKFGELLDPVVVVPSMREWQPWRLDLVWNFDHPARPLVLAHAALRVPRIRAGATLFAGGQGVSWCSEKKRLMVKLYDKSRKMRVRGSILRAEISLRGAQLYRRCRQQDWCNFNVLYGIYRGIMASLPPIQKLTEANNWQEALGPEPPEIRQRVMARLSHKPARTFSRWQRRVEAAAAELPEDFSWENVLPPEGPPPAINVQPRLRCISP